MFDFIFESVDLLPSEEIITFEVSVVLQARRMKTLCGIITVNGPDTRERQNCLAFVLVQDDKCVSIGTEVWWTEDLAHLECARRAGILDAPVRGVSSKGTIHEFLDGPQDL